MYAGLAVARHVAAAVVYNPRAGVTVLMLGYSDPLVPRSEVLAFGVHTAAAALAQAGGSRAIVEVITTPDVTPSRQTCVAPNNVALRVTPWTWSEIDAITSTETLAFARYLGAGAQVQRALHEHPDAYRYVRDAIAACTACRVIRGRRPSPAA